MTAATGASPLFTRDRLQIWGVIALMALLMIGIAVFIFLVLLPDVHRRSDNNLLLTSAKADLNAALLARASAPAKLQTELATANDKLNKVAAAFLNEAESTLVVNRLYTYAEAANAAIVNLQAAPPVVAATHSQRDYQFQVAGSVKSLFDFLRRIKEVEIPGFVINNVSIVPAPGATTAQDQHLLSMKLSVLSSPYSTQTVLGPTQNPEKFADVGNLPLAEVQRQVEVAWVARDWEQAINLLQQVVESSPTNDAARIALYRAHVNAGYRYMDQRNPEAAKSEFETALSVLPNGQEASAELQQLASDSDMAHRVEDQLRQQLAAAKNAGDWREVIRLLRIIAVVDPDYGPVDGELTEAYTHYGDALAMAGNSVAAQEQYQLAQYMSSGQIPATTDVAVAIAQPLSGTLASAVVAAPLPTVVVVQSPAPTAMPTPLPPTLTPMPTATTIPTQPPTPTQTPVPTATPPPTATQPPAATATATSQPPATSTPVATSGATATPSVTPPGGATATPTTLASPSLTTQLPPPTATYIVQQGDTLFSIARRFGISVEALRSANGLTGDTIRVGQVLFITPASQQPTQPGFVDHVVAPNDTLFSLAQRFGTTVEAIMQANGLNNSNIFVGQHLLIPTPVSAQPLTPSPNIDVKLPEFAKLNDA